MVPSAAQKLPGEDRAEVFMREKRKGKRKYTKELPRVMYCYFRDYSGDGVPSFRKFAESIGATLSEIEAFRAHDEFDRSYRECNEIRRDYLIDYALCRRFDPSFVKFLLGAEYGEADTDGELSLKLEVVK